MQVVAYIMYLLVPNSSLVRFAVFWCSYCNSCDYTHSTTSSLWNAEMSLIPELKSGLATWSPIYSLFARPVAGRPLDWQVSLHGQWETRWEESAKNSLWQIFRVVDASSYLQYRFAQRTEQSRNSRAQHFNSDLQGSSRSCSLLLCGFNGDPWELSFDFIASFCFIFILNH